MNAKRCAVCVPKIGINFVGENTNCIVLVNCVFVEFVIGERIDHWGIKQE